MFIKQNPIKPYPRTPQELKEQLSAFEQRLARTPAEDFEQLNWFAELIDKEGRFNDPKWAIFQFKDLEIQIQRQGNVYRVEKILGYLNNESMFDEEGFLKEGYQDVLPLTEEMEEELALAI